MDDSIRSFLQRWAVAEQAGDAAALGEFLTDDFTGIGPVGFVLPKAAWVGRHGNGLHYDAFDVDEIQVRTYGDVAVAVARDTQHGTAFGHPVPEALRTTHILVRQGGSWRLASVHMSFIAGTPGAPPAPGAPSAPAAPPTPH
jgi:ketosteroid isomerase-like protein